MMLSLLFLLLFCDVSVSLSLLRWWSVLITLRVKHIESLYFICIEFKFTDVVLAKDVVLEDIVLNSIFSLPFDFFIFLKIVEEVNEDERTS